ncbi:MAG TPA: hypothetical protein VIA06_24120, partial [Candidatus Dormibacteraeota bacterium]|nr:hypothetical protein [Candidatus Dormibacteraeota bacterium]
MPAIAWLPGAGSRPPGPGPAALRIAAPLPVPGEPASLPLGMAAVTRSTIPGLRLLPAASFLFWEVSRPEGEGAEPGAGGTGEQQEREEREPDLRLRLLARLQPPLGLCLDPDGVVDWPHDLMPFQVQGVRLLHDRDRLLLADEMGLGKT